MSNSAEEDIIIFYIPNSINHNFFYECNAPKFSTNEWAFIDGETNGNIKALTGRENDISIEDED